MIVVEDINRLCSMCVCVCVCVCFYIRCILLIKLDLLHQYYL